jgi:hypothetical protein
MAGFCEHSNELHKRSSILGSTCIKGLFSTMELSGKLKLNICFMENKEMLLKLSVY